MYKIYICGVHPIMTVRGNPRRNLHASQGGLSGSSQLSQAARLTHVSEAKSNSRWAIRLDDDDDDANDKVRTTVPLQNRATATSKTQESLLKTQY